MTSIILRDSQKTSKLNSSKGITRTFLSAYESTETIINGFVSLVVNIFMFAITTLTPLAAPIAPAFSVYKALSERLETPFAIALAGAIAIEITGMFVAKTSIAAHNWNSARNKTDPEAPKGLAITMAAIFFSVIFILSLTIELNPNLVIWIYPGFVVVAITVYVCLAISNNLKDWEQRKAQDLELRELKNGLNAEIREAKKDIEKLTQQAKIARQELTTLDQELTAKRQEKLALENDLNQLKATVNNGQYDEILTVKSQFGPDNLDKAKKAKKSKVTQRREQLLTLLDSQNLTQKELAEKLGVSPSTIKSDLRAMNGTVK